MGHISTTNKARRFVFSMCCLFDVMPYLLYLLLNTYRFFLELKASVDT